MSQKNTPRGRVVGIKNNHMKKLLLTVIVTAVIVGGGAFYGGIEYQKSKSVFVPGGNIGNLSAEERQARFGNDVGAQRQGINGGTVSGEVISIDDESITVKIADGGSKIVFFSTSTKIQKSADGTREDLKEGEQVLIMGSVNQDGSVSAQSIQLRPNFPVGNR